tara:strand:+ start:43 stop:333 length:291 start_codon:yes stop_codon:yes gene_type:complete
MSIPQILNKLNLNHNVSDLIMDNLLINVNNCEDNKKKMMEHLDIHIKLNNLILGQYRRPFYQSIIKTIGVRRQMDKKTNKILDKMILEGCSIYNLN